MNPRLEKCDACGRIIGFGAHDCIAGKLPTTDTILSAILRTPNGCWEWTGHITDSGYGIFAFGGLKNRTRVRVHRLTWELFNGAVPSGFCVLHHCDNRKCCNPEHLFIGTRKDNTDDMCQKRRHAFGARNGNAILTESQVFEIRSSTLKVKTLASMFGVDKETIRSAQKGISWKHIAEKNTPKTSERGEVP